MKYTKPLKEFLQEDSLHNRIFLLETEKETHTCYESLLQYKKRHQSQYFLYILKKENAVLVSKQEMGMTMEYKDNINPELYGIKKINYGSKYARVFTEFIDNDEIRNREIKCDSLNQAKSCYASMMRLRKSYDMEKRIRIKINSQTKKVLLQKIN